jgi:FKBP-type peptidyl-prolyl cis-trans isomerase FkpA
MVFIGAPQGIRVRSASLFRGTGCGPIRRCSFRKQLTRCGNLQAVTREEAQKASTRPEWTTRRQFLQRVAALASGLTLVWLGNRRSTQAKGNPVGGLDLSKFTKDNSGVLYRDYKDGTGASPKDGDLVVINYIGYLSSGMIFDNTTAKGRKPLAFIYGKKQMVPGVERGIESMKVGGKRRLIVPSDLAFGERGVCLEGQGCLVPPNETLTYDIELMRVSVAPF